MSKIPKLVTALSLVAAVAACDGVGGQKKEQETQVNNARDRVTQVVPTATETASPEPIQVASTAAKTASQDHMQNSVQAARKSVNNNPVICINGSLKWNRNAVYPKFDRVFRMAGARPVRVNPENFKSKAGTCNAFVLVGGPDIDTRKLEGKNKAPLHPKAHLLTPERQEFDRLIVRYSREKLKPLLGECLGMQEIGVWEGKGAFLNQHIPDNPDAVNHRDLHTVDFSEEASVFGLGTGPRMVNSNHHQALRKPTLREPMPVPKTLNVVARSEDGIPEAIISKNGLFWGIQFHPREGTREVVIYDRFADLAEREGGTQIK